MTMKKITLAVVVLGSLLASTSGSMAYSDDDDDGPEVPPPPNPTLSVKKIYNNTYNIYNIYGDRPYRAPPPRLVEEERHEYHSESHTYRRYR